MPVDDNEGGQEKRDCLAKLARATEELNGLLAKAAELGIEREVNVYESGGDTETRDLSPLPPNVIYKFPQTDRQPRYPQIFVGKPGQFKNKA